MKIVPGVGVGLDRQTLGSAIVCFEKDRSLACGLTPIALIRIADREQIATAIVEFALKNADGPKFNF